MAERDKTPKDRTAMAMTVSTSLKPDCFRFGGVKFFIANLLFNPAAAGANVGIRTDTSRTSHNRYRTSGERLTGDADKNGSIQGRQACAVSKGAGRVELHDRRTATYIADANSTLTASSEGHWRVRNARRKKELSLSRNCKTDEWTRLFSTLRCRLNLIVNVLRRAAAGKVRIYPNKHCTALADGELSCNAKLAYNNVH